MMVYSNKELTQNQLHKIDRILAESQCPNESLRMTFPQRYRTITTSGIYFDNPPYLYGYETLDDEVDKE